MSHRAGWFEPSGFGTFGFELWNICPLYWLRVLVVFFPSRKMSGYRLQPSWPFPPIF